MKTLAQQIKEVIGANIHNDLLIAVAREEMADLYSNKNYSWIEFSDGSVLSSNCSDLKAYKRKMSFHKDGVSW